ncbi:hypothetical protein GCM10007424_03990 [Flavobacterium suaedae]|uniref:STAS/SEC14 domain-containing protein n=1 Tax=Flavobacterium suaedae TaxID=1767027 RepID=A0ABQ1JJ00_9FLAO|nr:STAS/SEC14 domain-containing protein [Flavobacterium suaedae]GGB67205.1 hypothetical protein GCM10007424_03990 [Flavobacterium suaedae]
MITYINNLPENMVGFRSQGEVTSKDFELVKKHVKELVERTGELNYLLLLENSPKDFSVGAWLQDVLLGIENITKWNRVAIVSDSDTVIDFTDGFSKVMPGEFKGYHTSDYNDAVNWVSGKVNV